MSSGWHSVRGPVGEALNSAGLPVMWAERVFHSAPAYLTSHCDEPPPRVQMGTTRHAPYILPWLYALLSHHSPMLLHNEDAYRGGRLCWVRWVSRRQRVLAAAYAMGGPDAMMAAYCELHRVRPDIRRP